jgi:hypothetical protein
MSREEPNIPDTNGSKKEEKEFSSPRKCFEIIKSNSHKFNPK